MLQLSPPSLWPSPPTLIKSSFYSDKHSHVIYIETMPGQVCGGEIYINYSNPLLPSTTTNHHSTGRVWKYSHLMVWTLRQEDSPARPPGWSRLPAWYLSVFAGPDCVDCRYGQIFRERPPPCVNMHQHCTNNYAHQQYTSPPHIRPLTVQQIVCYGPDWPEPVMWWAGIIIWESWLLW